VLLYMPACLLACLRACAQVVDTVLRSNAVQLIAVDSVAALLPRAEQEGDMGMIQVRWKDVHIGYDMLCYVM
jgi:hypothetical protein